jgi:exonuclease VII large subunit
VPCSACSTAAPSSNRIAVLAQSGFQVAATHFPAPLEGEAAPARIAAQIRAAGVGNQAVLVVRGGGEDAQLSPFDSAPVVSAIATAPVPVITGIGHSHHATWPTPPPGRPACRRPPRPR